MTNRAFYEAVINANVNAEITDFAKAAIEKLNARNEARKDKPTKAQEQAKAIRAEIMAKVEPNVQYTAAVVAELVGITPNQASGHIGVLTKAGYFEKGAVKIKGAANGKVNCYIRTDKPYKDADAE